MKPYHQIIHGPIITEKTHSLKEAGNKITLKGKRPDWKKAIVTLAPGEKLKGFEGL